MGVYRLSEQRTVASDDELFRRCEESRRRSRERREAPRPPRRPPLRWDRLPAVVAFVVALALGLKTLTPELAELSSKLSAIVETEAVPARAGNGAGGGPALAMLLPSTDAGASGGRPHAAAKTPTAAAVRDAWRYARARGGAVSFAVTDTEGELRGRAEGLQYSSASVVKAMLLAAELRRLKHAGLAMDPTTDSLLSAMITYSDNGAADAIYTRVGDAGLLEVARRAGMRGFTIAGYWGTAQLTAADMARFFGDLDRMLPRRHRVYGKGLLGSVVETQRWGIPAAAGDRWAVRFKGGWLPDHALAHQAAELRERHGDRELALAIFTDLQPSHEYATETVRGVASRLLARR